MIAAKVRKSKSPDIHLLTEVIERVTRQNAIPPYSLEGEEMDRLEDCLDYLAGLSQLNEGATDLVLRRDHFRALIKPVEDTIGDICRALNERYDRASEAAKADAR